VLYDAPVRRKPSQNLPPTKMKTDLTSIIVTIVSSGVGAGFVTFWMNFLKAEWDFRRAKIEELYAAVHKYTKTTQLIALSIRAGGKALEFVPNTVEEFDRIELLTNLYFPRLLPTFNQLRTNIASLLKIERLGETSEDFEAEFLRICEIGDKFKAEVVTLSRQRSLRAWIEAVQDYDSSGGKERTL
jgi:hypothetical protein